MTSSRRVRTPSNIYVRLLRGQTTPERFVAVLKRAVDMRIRAHLAKRDGG